MIGICGSHKAISIDWERYGFAETNDQSAEPQTNHNKVMSITTPLTRDCTTCLYFFQNPWNHNFQWQFLLTRWNSMKTYNQNARMIFYASEYSGDSATKCLEFGWRAANVSLRFWQKFFSRAVEISVTQHPVRCTQIDWICLTSFICDITSVTKGSLATNSWSSNSGLMVSWMLMLNLHFTCKSVV